jgi:ATP-dependent DNA ligase
VKLPLLERKAAPRRVVPTNPGQLRYTEHVDGNGTELFRVVCEVDLEGVVAKHKEAPYGLEKAWLKIKNPTYSQAEGRLELFETRTSKKPALPEVRPVPADRGSRSPRRTG